MLNVTSESLQNLLLKGRFGLEKESLRVTEDGRLAHTRHPFGGHPNITRDFCENQTEINTPVANSAAEAVELLKGYYVEAQKTLAAANPREYLWPISNPPFIENEADIPVAIFTGDQSFKTRYRQYLSSRYGRYLMTFSGIHFNYSFNEELLKQDFENSGLTDFQDYKNHFYLELAKKAAAYGWLMVAVTAASPVLDPSFIGPGETGGTLFTGKGSVRCSENGYWNFFTPTFDYRTLESYTDSIEAHVKKGVLAAPSELYFPVRLKPKGDNSLDNLREGGANHIELRMFDLNPLDPVGVDLRDVKFGELFLAFLACTQDFYFPEQDQIQAVQNFKNAAHYDLEHTKIIILGGHCCSVAEAGRIMLHQMKEFYRDFPEDVQEVLRFEELKFTDSASRYAVKVRALLGDQYLENGLALAKERQAEAIV